LDPWSTGIWKGLPWSVALKEAFDGFIYSLLVAALWLALARNAVPALCVKWWRGRSLAE